MAKQKQGFLKGMRPRSIRALDDATENYYEAMQARLPYTKKEAEAKDNLIEKLIEHKVDRYETPDGLVATRTSKATVAVKRKKEENEDDAKTDE